MFFKKRLDPTPETETQRPAGPSMLDGLRARIAEAQLPQHIQEALASEIGQGSRFVLSLPLPALDPGERAGIKPPLPRREREPQRALRLLLAEDNQANVSIVQLFLENSNHT